MRKCIQMIRRLFGKLRKTRPLPKEEVEEDAAGLQLEECADGSEEQKDWGEKQENLQSTCSQEILLSLNKIFQKHAECSENLLREMTKLADVIAENTQKTSDAEMESTAPLAVSQDITPALKSMLPFSLSSFISSARTRLSSLKKLQHSCVESSMNSNLNTGDVKPPQTPKLAWDANQCFMNTEEIMLADNTDVMNDVELQNVEEEAMSPMIGNIPNVPLDEKTGLLEMEFHSKTAEWFSKMEEKAKLKLEMDEVKQKRQKEIKDLKLEVKILKMKAKREKQEGKTKLKDLEKEMKDEKSKVLLELKELKKKLRMEKKEERNRKKMEKHMKDDEDEHEVNNKQGLNSKFKAAFKFRG